MDIDAQNAKQGNLNDEQKQQVLARRNLLGGIIKRGDPLHKNILNVTILLVLLPYMICTELYAAGKDLTFYLWETFKSSIKLIIKTAKEVKKWIIITSIKSFAFCQYILIKTIMVIAILLLLLGDKTIIKIRQFITWGIIKPAIIVKQKFNQLYTIISLYAIKGWNIWVLKIVNPIQKHIFIALTYMANLAITYYLVIKAWMGVQIQKLKLIIDRFIEWTIQKGIILYEIMMEILIAYYSKLRIFVLAQYGKLKIITIQVVNIVVLHMKQWAYFAKIKSLQFSKFAYEHLVRYYKYILIKSVSIYCGAKEKTIEFGLLTIEYTFEKFHQIQEEIIKPTIHTTRKILIICKERILDFLIWLIEKINDCLTYLKDNTIPKCKAIFQNIWKRGSEDTWIIFSYFSKWYYAIHNRCKHILFVIKQHTLRIFLAIQQTSILWVNCIKQFLYTNGAKCSFYLQKRYQSLKLVLKLGIKKVQDAYIFTAVKTKSVWHLLVNIVKKFYAFAIQTGNRGKNKIISIYKIIAKAIQLTIQFTINCLKYILEKGSKILIRRFIPILKAIIMMDKLIDKTSTIFFSILLFPVTIRDKVLNTVIEVLFFQIPSFVKMILKTLLRWFVNTYQFICYISSLIKKQTKKVARIIHNKFIMPVVDFVKSIYLFAKEKILKCVEYLINLKNMIKYDYVLPAWATIRLFAQAQQIRIQAIVKKLKELWIQFQIRRRYYAELRRQRIKLFIQKVKAYLDNKKEQLLEPLRQLGQYLKSILNQAKNQLIYQIQKLKLLGVEVKNLIAAILQNVVLSLRQRQQILKNQLSEILISIKQQMNLVKQSCAFQYNLIVQSMNNQKETVRMKMQQIQDNVKQQINQIKASFTNYRNEMILSIKIIWQSLRGRQA